MALVDSIGKQLFFGSYALSKVCEDRKEKKMVLMKYSDNWLTQLKF